MHQSWIGPAASPPSPHAHLPLQVSNQEEQEATLGSLRCPGWKLQGGETTSKTGTRLNENWTIEPVRENLGAWLLGPSQNKSELHKVPSARCSAASSDAQQAHQVYTSSRLETSLGAVLLTSGTSRSTLQDLGGSCPLVFGRLDT